MIHELFPEIFVENDPQRGWKRTAIGRSDAIFCVSKNTRDDLARLYDLKDKQIHIVYHGDSLSLIDPQITGVEYPYLLYVGTRKSKHKNFKLICKSMETLKAESNLHLVCYGGGAFSDEEQRFIREMGLKECIHQVSGSDESLAGYYKKAVALVYPSNYEGFGLPPIEAMGCGCPVISSTAPPMPEIIEDAGLFFDPDDSDELTQCILSLQHEVLREELVNLGSLRNKRFKWESIADEAIVCYTSLLRNPYLNHE